MEPAQKRIETALKRMEQAQKRIETELKRKERELKRIETALKRSERTRKRIGPAQNGVESDVDSVSIGPSAGRGRLLYMTKQASWRKVLRDNIRTSNPILQASINVIGALDIVAQAVGQPAEEVCQLYDEANRWTAVEDELPDDTERRVRCEPHPPPAHRGPRRAGLQHRHAVGARSGPRRPRAPRAGDQAVEELQARKKAAQAPGTPPPTNPASQDPGTSGSPQA
jgi:hypothetical protein